GADCTLMVDANQRWDVDEAIARVRALSRYNLWWIEEPTSPDDVLGHAAIAKGVAPIGVATGEHAANRVIFKQLMQANAIKFCQIDSCRLGGVNENLAVILMAAKFGVPVCPHAGGVGLCEYVQYLSMFDYLAFTGTMECRVTEYGFRGPKKGFLVTVTWNGITSTPPRKTACGAGSPAACTGSEAAAKVRARMSGSMPGGTGAFYSE